MIIKANHMKINIRFIILFLLATTDKKERMNKLKSNSLIIFLSTFLFTVLTLTECDRDFSIFEIKQEVRLTVTIDTADTAGEVKVTNHTDQTIYVPYIHYRFCHFFIYELEQELENSQFDTLWYHWYIYGEDTVLGKWRREPTRVTCRCMEDKHPVQLEPSQSFTQKISGLKPGRYRITVYYSYSEEEPFDSRPWKNHFADPSNWYILKEQFILKCD